MSDSPLTPDQDDAVRALLAAARHTEPTPPDVVARLDAELASLTADRREERAPAPVVSLAARRRRTAATLLLAAAAVVVAGVGIVQVLPSTDGGDSSAGSAADTSTLEDAPMSAGAGDPDLGDDGGTESKTQAEPGATSETTQGEAQLRVPASVPVAVSGLSSKTALKPQVRQVRQAAARTTTARSYAADAACVLPAAESAEETVVSVTYDDAPGALVFRAPVAGTQQVDVFVCGEAVAERSLTLRAP